MEEASDQPTGDAYVYALTDEPAYLQTDDDEKPTIIAEPPPDLAKFKCWFCRKSHEQVHTLFGAEYPVRDPHDFANETLIFICNECVTRFAESLTQESLKAPRTPSVAGRDRPCRARPADPVLIPEDRSVGGVRTEAFSHRPATHG